MPNPYNPALTAQIFAKDGVDRWLGRTDRLPQSGTYQGQYYHEPIWVWRDDVSGAPTWFSNARFQGDAHDAWHADGNNVFSPWSNPAARFSYNPTLFPGAMRILAENSDGSVRVHFYTTNPGDAPPSLPQAFSGTTTTGFNGITHPRLIWEPNIEPSLAFGAVEMWRQLQPYGQDAGVWTLMASLTASSESYVDESINGARLTGGGNVVRYRIRVVDGGGMASNYTKEWEMYYGDNPLKTIYRDAERSLVSNAFVSARLENNNIIVSSATSDIVSLRMYDLLGRNIYSAPEHNCNGGVCSFALPTATFPSGRYYCIVYVDGTPSIQMALDVLH